MQWCSGRSRTSRRWVPPSTDRLHSHAPRSAPLAEGFPLDVRPRVLSRLADVAPAAWDALFDPAYPFTRHAWLDALERHGCVSPQLGWEPRHLLLEDAQGRVVAGAPCYLKHHSYGEFVFDFAWADASHRLGRPYYPKGLCAVPFVPATGPRLGAVSDAAREALVGALDEAGDVASLSSLHVLFATAEDGAALRSAGFLERHDVQFQWHNAGYVRFEDFLSRLNSEKRKKLLRERRRIRESGIGFEVLRGRDLDPRGWEQVYRLYAQTYAERGQLPYYTPEFLFEVGNHAQLDVRLIFAVHEGRRVAMALLLVGGDTLYGRHWGAEAHYHSLHFECCYYQGVELCIRENLSRFDAGTQGAHKHARGFEPVRTRSLHRLRDPRLHAAVAEYLQRERRAVAAQQHEFMHHTPYRADTAPG